MRIINEITQPMIAFFGVEKAGNVTEVKFIPQSVMKVTQDDVELKEGESLYGIKINEMATILVAATEAEMNFKLSDNLVVNFVNKTIMLADAPRAKGQTPYFPKEARSIS